MTVETNADAVVIGAGPAGASTAILLASAGWRVVLAEQHSYPRHKVCGECIGAGGIGLLDELGVGAAFRRIAGPELRQIGWMSCTATIVAQMPPCTVGAYRFGRALGRDQLDALLLDRAREVGVTILQPAKVRAVRGEPGRFVCEIVAVAAGTPAGTGEPGATRLLRAPVVVDAHGSWEKGLKVTAGGVVEVPRTPRRSSDLFAFKASFRGAALAPGVLPVIAFDRGYGGIVVSDNARTVLACCIRRDALQACRALTPGASVGEAIETHLRHICPGIREALDHAHRIGPWLAVGPVTPGIHLGAGRGLFRVGNAAGETHPLIGEGIGMAMQSAVLLANNLTQQAVGKIDAHRANDLQRSYAAAWHSEFAPRLLLANAYAHLAMRPRFAATTRTLLNRWPMLLTGAARLAGKARPAVLPI